MRRGYYLPAVAAVAVAMAVATLSSSPATAAAASAAPQAGAVRNPASLVNPLIGTSGSVFMYPGAVMPFGMMQWSPDTYPDRAGGGGYEYNDSQILGYSLTHLSGGGCSAEGDVPILPTVGPIGSSPSATTETFSHSDETAKAGYYASTLGNGVTTKITDSTRAGIATFTFPATTQANLLLKLSSSNSQVDGTSAQVVSDDEVTGSVTSGHFCGVASSLEQDYTLHFDIVFSRPFTATGTWGGTASSSVTPGASSVTGTDLAHTARPAPKAPAPSTKVFAGARPDLAAPPASDSIGQATQTAVTNPDGLYVTFDTTAAQTVTAKVGISYVSDANAAANLATEIPGWSFGRVRTANQRAWNAMLRRIQITGGSHTQQVEFYTALYHALLEPSVFSDDNGQYMGYDGQVHTVSKGQHAEYANYSGWDIYRDQVQLAAMLAPQQTSDSITSMLHDYEQTGMLPKWNLDAGESYVMVGDPADSIIADAYAFGARDFNVSEALQAMAEEATVPNNIRPGLAAEDQYGYLPIDDQSVYSDCCDFYGPVSTQLEYDTADYAIAALAKATGDMPDYTKFATLAQSWENVFNIASGYMQPKQVNGQWAPGWSPGSANGFVEGTSAQYTPMVPFNLRALINAQGGSQTWVNFLNSLTSNLTSPGDTNANLSNEPSLEIPYEYDYAGAPYLTQQVVRQVEQQLYFDAPVGQFGNDDMGAMSSAYVWDELGFYPETPGTPILALSSPVFTKAVVHSTHGTLTINAPDAAADAPYIHSMTVNGRSWDKAYLDYSRLQGGTTLSYQLSSSPDTSWASSPSAAPPSDPTGEQPVLTSGPSQAVDVAPSGSTTIQIQAQNVTSSSQTVHASWQAPTGLTITSGDRSGTFDVPPGQAASLSLTIQASPSAAQTFYQVPITLTDGPVSLPGLTLLVVVAPPGSVLASFNNAGIATDANPGIAEFDTSGHSYSADALAAAGLTPGATVTAGGVQFTWPAPAAGLPDNVVASGQQITVSAPAGTQTLGFLGAASNGPGQGVATLHYSDGSSAQYWLGLSDWALGGDPTATPSYGNQIVAALPYRESATGQDPTKTYVFYTGLPVDPSKTLTSVTLPSEPGPLGVMHIFAVGTSTQPLPAPEISSLSTASASAGQQVTINGSGFGATQGSGYVHFADTGTNWGAPGNADTFQLDSWSDTAITFTVPVPSGPGGQYYVTPGTQASVEVVTSSGAATDIPVLEITPTDNPADYYDNVGISDDTNQSCGAFDGSYSYSAQALAAAGLTPGATFTADGLTFTWPNVPSCTADNILPFGQTMLVNGTAGATTLGLVGASSNGATSGTITINYTDGTSSTATVTFNDWATAPSGDDTAVATMSYRNAHDGTSDQRPMYVFATTVPVDSSKTVASITFPTISMTVGGVSAMHIFAVSLGS